MGWEVRPSRTRNKLLVHASQDAIYELSCLSFWPSRLAHAGCFALLFPLAVGFTVPFDILAENYKSACNRAAMVVKINYFWAGGAVLLPLLEYVCFEVMEWGWREFVVTCGVPTVVALVVGYYTVPER